MINTLNRVLDEEAYAIQDIKNIIDDNVLDFIEDCDTCCGKLILTGMGKSGHVAKKISATLASLGKPSFYLHPGEAAHGDLGMIEAKDVLIMISNSGETDELIQLLHSVKIIGCKLLGIFCRANSTLQQYCDRTVVLPVKKEACINNLAPTTSTTATMAFGDAIAVALSEKNHFQKEEFAIFHPKGALGKKLLVTVKRLMTKSIQDISVNTNQSIEDVLWVITKNGLGAAAVVDKQGKLVGLITDGDIRRCLEKKIDITHTNVEVVMTKNPVVATEEMLAIDALYLLQERKKSVLPIKNQKGDLLGIISIHDILNAGIKG